MDCHSQGAHEFLNVRGSDELDRRRGRVPITGQWVGLSKRSVQLHESRQTLESAVCRSNKAGAILVGVPGIESLFPIVTVLLGAIFDPTLVDILEGTLKRCQPSEATFVISLYSDVQGAEGSSFEGMVIEMVAKKGV